MVKLIPALHIDIYAIMFFIAAILAAINLFLSLTPKLVKFLNFGVFVFAVAGAALSSSDARDSTNIAIDTNVKVTETKKTVNTVKEMENATQEILKSVKSLDSINGLLTKNINTVVNKTEKISLLISRTTDTLNKFSNGGDSYPYFFIDPQRGYLNRLVRTVGRYPLNGVVVRISDLNQSNLSYYSFLFEDTMNTKQFDVPVVTVPHLLDKFYYPANLINERTFAFQIRITTQKGEYEEYFALRFRYKVFTHISKITSLTDNKTVFDTSSNFLNKGETAEYFFEHIRDSSYLNKHVYPYPQINENGVY